MNDEINLAIIGSGPAGLTAAIYASRAGLSPVIFSGTNIGGQLMQTTMVENYPGFPEGILGPQLMQNMLKQAENLGSVIKYETIDKVDFHKKPFELYVADKKYTAKAVIVATGAIPLRLGLESEDKFWGRGVSACATCDGAFFKDKTVAVIGGGNVAFEDAIYMTNHAKKVYLVHRREEFRAEKVMVDKAKNNPKIEFVLNYEVGEILGKDKVEGVKLVGANDESQSKELAVDGVFVAIGYKPKTDIFDGNLELNAKGYAVAKNKRMSNIDGIFVAGDVEDYEYRQAITAAADGCKAAMDAELWFMMQK